MIAVIGVVLRVSAEERRSMIVWQSASSRLDCVSVTIDPEKVSYCVDTFLRECAVIENGERNTFLNFATKAHCPFNT